MKFKVIFLLITLPISLTIAKEKALIKNGDFQKKSSWEIDKGKYVKNKKGNGFIVLYGQKEPNLLSQKIDLPPGDYIINFKIKGKVHTQMLPRVFTGPLRAFGHSQNSFASLEVFGYFSDGKKWANATARIKVKKRHRYLVLALKAPPNFKKPYYMLFDDFVVLKDKNPPKPHKSNDGFDDFEE